MDLNEESVDDTVSWSFMHEWDLSKDASFFSDEKSNENVNYGENQNRVEDEGEQVVNVGHQLERDRKSVV